MPMNCGNWAALWHRHGIASIDQKSDSRALRTLARYGAVVQRRTTGSVLQVIILHLLLGIARACRHTMPVGIFAGAKPRHRAPHCKIVVRIDQSLTRTAATKTASLRLPHTL